jgi:hypothetical protein
VAGVWRRARPCRIAGTNAAILCPDDFLVHLCLHLAFDEPFVGKIRDVVDIARLLQLWEGQIDWPRLISEAHARGYAGLMYYALYTVVAMLDARVNREVLDAFRRDITQRWWEDRLLKFIVSRSVALAGEPDAVLPRWVLQEVCTTLLSNDVPGRRLRSLLGLTCAPVGQPEGERPSPGPSGSSLARPSLVRSCETGLRLGARVAKALGRRLRAARAS